MLINKESLLKKIDEFQAGLDFSCDYVLINSIKKIIKNMKEEEAMPEKNIDFIWGWLLIFAAIMLIGLSFIFGGR